MVEQNTRRADVADNGQALRDQVYDSIRSALMSGQYVAGQKLKIRQLAAECGTSLTPVRECLRRLVAQGVLEGEANRSVRVPRMTSDKIRELRDIRLAVEGLAARRASERITTEEISSLRTIAEEIENARMRGDIEADVARIGEFHLGVYRAARMPHLTEIIESLWLQTGPYIRFLFPSYVQSVRERHGDWRGHLCDALEAKNADLAQQIIIQDVSESLDYLITIVDAAGALGTVPSS